MEISTAIKALENRRKIEAEILGSKESFNDYICYKFAQVFSTVPRVIKIDLKILGYDEVENCNDDEYGIVLKKIDEVQSQIAKLDSDDKLAEFGIWKHHKLPNDWAYIGNKSFKFASEEGEQRFKRVAQDLLTGMRINIALLFAQKENRALSVKEVANLNKMRIIKYSDEEWNRTEDIAYGIFMNPYFPKKFSQTIARDLTGVSRDVLQENRPKQKSHIITYKNAEEKDALKQEVYRRWKEENITQNRLAEYAAKILGKDKIDRRTISNWIAEMKVEDGFDGRIRNTNGTRQRNSLEEKSKEFVKSYDKITDRQISYYEFGKEIGVSREDVRRYLKKQGRGTP